MKIRNVVNKAVFGLKKHGPTIAAVASILGVGATGVLSARAAYKTSKKIDEFKEHMDGLRASKEILEPKEYNELVFFEYKEISKELAKQYWPALLAAGLSGAGMVYSHKTMKNRYIAAASLYTALNAAFIEYRGRVADKIGKDAEFELRTGVKKSEIVEVVTDKKGNEKTKVTKVTEPGDHTDLDILLFDETSPYYRKGCPEMNLLFIQSLQKSLTAQLVGKLQRVLINDVYRAFDYDETAEGTITGWVYDPDDPTCDCAVDFGIFDKDYKPLDTPNVRDFLSGKNEFIYLTLNHDGIIFERFPKLIAARWGNNAGRV